MDGLQFEHRCAESVSYTHLDVYKRQLLYSGLSPDHAKILSQRMLSIYQGYLLLGRISNNTSFLKNARKNMLEMYREYRSYHEI